MAARRLTPVLGVFWLVLAGCQPPVLNNLVDNTGPERSLVMVDGSSLLFSSVVWDAGLPTEQQVPGGFLGGYMFSVPPGASPGPHPVALRNTRGTSGTLTFTVTAPVPFGAPRVDRVSLLGISFDGGNVEPVLYVQGANVDVGAVVQVNGADVATVAHRGLQNELYGTDPTVMGYPIYHYLSLLAVAGTQTAGAALSVTVRNLDGQLSQAVTYALPDSAATLDSDGDNLLDAWETGGYDADGDGTIDVDLPALGAHPRRPDLLVEVDIMTGLANPPIPATATDPGTLEMAQAVFRAAPVLNPLGQEGINLILDASGTVPFTQTVDFGTVIQGPAGTTDFFTLKNANFANATRDRIYHYAIWGNALVGGYSGVSDVDFGGSENGDDFLVSFDDFSASFQTMRSQVETFVHELGHNIGQRHGGDTHSQFKPNYWSVMSYAWQLRSGRSDATRRTRTTCTPIYWADPGATEVNGAAPATVNAIVDYSHGMGPTVVENNGSLNEPTGVCGVAVYWNGDTDATDVNLSLDADDNGGAAETLMDVSNWRVIDYRGPESDGSQGT
jgi:hypothetical protein